MLHPYLYFFAVFMFTTLQNLLPVCLPSSSGLAAHDFLPTLLPILSRFLIQMLTSITILSFLLLVISGTSFLHLYLPHPMIFSSSRGEYQDTSPSEFGLPFGTSLLNRSSDSGLFFYFTTFILPFNYFHSCNKKKRTKIPIL